MVLRATAHPLVSASYPDLRMIRDLLRRDFASREFGAYILASLLALMIDLAILVSLSRIVHYLVAATAGFCAGAAVNYFLSKRHIFAQRRLGHREGFEAALFALVGVAGLALNNAVIFLLVELVGMPLAPSKLAAACATFLFNFQMRKRLLF